MKAYSSTIVLEDGTTIIVTGSDENKMWALTEKIRKDEDVLAIMTGDTDVTQLYPTEE